MAYTPRQADLIWLDFSPQTGHEQKGRRPALVVSNDFFNQRTGLILVCPVTSARHDYPLHVPLDDTGGIKGYVMVEQVRSVDYEARHAVQAGQAGADVMAEVLARLEACL